VSDQLHASSALSPGKEPLDKRLDGPSEPVWTIWRSEHFLPYLGLELRPLVVQPGNISYTYCTVQPRRFQISAFHAEINSLSSLVEQSPWRRVVSRKLIASVKQLIALYGTGRFIATFTRTCVNFLKTRHVLGLRWRRPLYIDETVTESR
jgi:hypothetical protein